MKYKDSVSAIIGGSFFAIPYLALATPLLPSILIGGAAFIAGELVLSNKQSSLKESDRNLYLTLEQAKKQNKHILSMIPLIENEDVQKDLNEINDTVDKIITTISKSPKKIKSIGNFFDYYLPITIKLVDRYDEIENQKLSSSESKKFLTSTNNMIKEINKSFKKVLAKLYKSEIVDTSADMKVLDSLIKSDGFDEDDIETEEN